MALIIVESPTKAKTIASFVDKDYLVEPCYGHIRDLPKNKLGVNIENNFTPIYVIPTKTKKRVNFLKKLASKNKDIILATDEDREGEAIAWHLKIALNLPQFENQKIKRIVFHEITKEAILKALQNPRDINLNLVNAQQARRILDRIVGYKLSPFLWKKVARGLSAGRVQSVALRLIVEREEEIKNFKPTEYWTINALVENQKGQFEILLYKINDKNLEKLDIKNKNEAELIKNELSKSKFFVSHIQTKNIFKSPPPPFITSTLQQVASNHLKFSSKKTMFLAQELYEKGLITYMRTDSTHLSDESLKKAHQWIKNNLPPNYLLEKPRKFKTKSRLAQEAHEAIRPTNPEIRKEQIDLSEDHKKLYDLIWKRFIASQISPALFLSTKVEVIAQSNQNKYFLKTNGLILKFDGFLKIWPMEIEEKILPVITQNESINLIEIKINQHFTEPPPRYTEASLIKILEKYGIGRPSTYAPIISIIQERNYVYKEGGKFYPTEIGILVNKILTQHFPQIVDVNFTAQMEKNLDKIAEGKKNWQNILKEFYEPFSKLLEQKYQEVNKKDLIEENTNEICNLCGKPMILKLGKFGKFLACSGFPECKNTKKIKTKDELNKEVLNILCPECLKDENRKQNPGKIIKRKIKNGKRKGKIFWGCSQYPECKYISWKKPEKTNF